VVGCWHGYLSGARCRLAYGPADATATDMVSCFHKIQISFTFLVPADPGSPGEGLLNGCVCVCVCQGIGDAAMAYQCLRVALASNNDHAEAYNNLGVLESRKARPDMVCTIISSLPLDNFSSASAKFAF